MENTSIYTAIGQTVLMLGLFISIKCITDNIGVKIRQSIKYIDKNKK